jgi:hypothetical protein
MAKKVDVLIFIILILSSLVFKSCVPEYYVVKKFRTSANVSILVIPNQLVYKTNTTIQELYPNFGDLSPQVQDSIWYANTKFLEKVSDSAVIYTFYSKFLNLLKKSEMKVFDYQNTASFNLKDTNAYILKIVQMEMEEKKQQIPYSQPVDNNQELFKEVEINSVTLNVWFELVRAAKDTLKPNLLFASFVISDEVRGRFFNTLNGYEFRFKRNDIDTTRILPMASAAGEKMAQYFYNHMLNVYAAYFWDSPDYDFRYVGKYIQKDKGYSFYYPTEDERFITIRK